jgi:hypothetical protein
MVYAVLVRTWYGYFIILKVLMLHSSTSLYRIILHLMQWTIELSNFAWEIWTCLMSIHTFIQKQMGKTQLYWGFNATFNGVSRFKLYLHYKHIDRWKCFVNLCFRVLVKKTLKVNFILKREITQNLKLWYYIYLFLFFLQNYIYLTNILWTLFSIFPD